MEVEFKALEIKNVFRNNQWTDYPDNTDKVLLRRIQKTEITDLQLVK